MSNKHDEKELILETYQEFIGKLIALDISNYDIQLYFKNDCHIFIPYNIKNELFLKRNINNIIGLLFIDGIYKFRIIKTTSNDKEQNLNTNKQTINTSKEDNDWEYIHIRKEIDAFLATINNET